MSADPIDAQRRAACAALLGSLLGATGCGGGGGDGGGGGAAGEGAPTAPLTLLASTPADRSADVARDVQPALTFSAALDPATVSAAAVQLSEAPGAVVPAALAVNGSTLGIDPVERLWPDAEYRIDAQGLSGRGGETLAAPFTSRFVTRDGQWSAAAVTTMTRVTSFDDESHRVAVAPDGSAVALWRLPDGANVWRLRASRRDAGGRWGAALDVDSSLPGDASVPSLVIAPDGSAYAAWYVTLGIGSRQQVVAGRLGPTDAAWSTPVQLSDDAVAVNVDPVLGVGAGGAVYAAWVGGSGSPYDILLSRRLDDGRWSPPVVANEANGRSVFTPALAVHGDGRVVLAWQEQDGNAIHLKARNYRPDIAAPEALGPAVELGSTGIAGSRIVRFHLALNARGDGAIAWDVDGGPERTVWVAIKSAALEPGWEPATALDAVATADLLPRVAVDDAGDVMAVWQGNEPGGLSRIFSRRYDRGLAMRGAGPAWSDLRELSDARGGGLPVLACDARGNALVVYQAINAEVLGARYTRRQGWQAPAVVNALATPGSIFEPRLAFDGRGSAVAIWIESDMVFRTAAPSYGFAIGGARFD